MPSGAGALHPHYDTASTQALVNPLCGILGRPHGRGGAHGAACGCGSIDCRLDLLTLAAARAAARPHWRLFGAASVCPLTGAAALLAARKTLDVSSGHALPKSSPAQLPPCPTSALSKPIARERANSRIIDRGAHAGAGALLTLAPVLGGAYLRHGGSCRPCTLPTKLPRAARNGFARSLSDAWSSPLRLRRCLRTGISVSPKP